MSQGFVTWNTWRWSRRKPSGKQHLRAMRGRYLFRRARPGRAASYVSFSPSRISISLPCNSIRTVPFGGVPLTHRSTLDLSVDTGHDAGQPVGAFVASGHVVAVHFGERSRRLGRVPSRQVDQPNLIFRCRLGVDRKVVAAAPVRVILFGVASGAYCFASRYTSNAPIEPKS